MKDEPFVRTDMLSRSIWFNLKLSSNQCSIFFKCNQIFEVFILFIPLLFIPLTEILEGSSFMQNEDPAFQVR